MSSTQSPDRISIQRKQPRFIWLIPFSVSAVYLSSDYYTPHNWQFAARICALSVILILVICTARHLHRDHRSQLADRIVRRYFSISSALAVLLMATRILIPVTSTPDHDPSRINAILNALLLFPFIALGICGVVLLLFSSTYRTSLALYCGLILVVTLALSMDNSTRSYLRSIVRSIPLTQRL
ncbi:MAG: hypothetical protein WCJ09_11055 [Planctomycetota bacterium]